MNSPASTKPKRLISKRDVRHRFGGVSDTTLWRMEKRGIIPKPIRFSNGLAMWPEDEIEAIIVHLAANRVW